MTIPIAAAQWRINHERQVAARTALDSGADQLHLDFGGAHRGPRLDEAGQITAAFDIARAIDVPVLAVNHANDIGLATADGAPNPEASALLEVALRCALRLGVRVLHVPGFRLSAPDSAQRRAGTVAILGELCERADASTITIAYESALSASDSIALMRAVDHPALRIVLDVGNLIDAGYRPEQFAAEVAAAGLLLGDIHVKNPTSTRQDSFLLASVLLARGLVDAILLENDYQLCPERLADDVHRCHATMRPSASVITAIATETRNPHSVLCQRD
jgi:2-epi-5-epi-valiolone 7-phosphate 2-epimerase